MIYWQLLWSFLKVGLFSFGGAYGAIPLIRDIVLLNGWLSDEMFTYFVAVSESTPGSIIINMATYIGSTQAGFWGAVLATTGVVLPSFVIILAIVAVMKNFIKNKYVQAVLRGIKPCFIGIVLAMGLYMIVNNAVSIAGAIAIDWQAAVITVILLALAFGYQRIRKKDFSPIMLIVLSAGMGIVLYAIPF
jgi:chromate transporter